MATTGLSSDAPALVGADDVSLAATLRVLDERTRAMAEVIDALRPLLAMAEQAPAMGAMLGDSFDDVMRTAMDDGIDVERGVINGLGAALRFGASMDGAKVRELQALLNSGVFAPNVLKIISELGRALTESASSPPPRVGPLRLLKAFGDPDVQRALGFLIMFAERFGSYLGKGPPLRR